MFPAIALFVVTAAFVVVRTGRDALYFQDDGLFGLPKAYMAIAVLALPQAVLVLALLRRLGGRRTRVGLLFIVAALVIGFHFVARPGGGLLMTSFFAAVPLLFSVLFSTLWLFCAELVETASKRQVALAYSRCGAGSIVGGVAGGLVARAIGPGLGPHALILIGGCMVAATGVWAVIGHQRCPLQPVADDPSPLPAGEPASPRLRSQPHLALLLAISMTAALGALLIEFQFYAVAAVSGEGSAGLTAFFANVYLLLGVASLLLQLVITPRLQRWFGLGGSLMVLPLALLGGATIVLASAGAAARAGLRVAEGGLETGVHRSVWEQAFLLFPRAIRPRVKVVVDGLGPRIAEGVAALLMYGWLAVTAPERAMGGLQVTWISVALVAAAIVWLGLTRVLGRRLHGDDRATDGEPWRAPLPDF